MKTYKVTVNGKIYQIDVEEVQKDESGKTATPSALPDKEPAKAVSPTGSSVGKIEAPIQGTLLSMKVKVGSSVKRGQVVAILEAMKMENEIVSPFDGTVSSVLVKDGQIVDSGATLLTISVK